MERERDNIISCSLVIVELTITMRVMRGDCRNDHQKVGLERILYASQWMTPYTAGTTSNLVGTINDMRSSKPNQPTCTPGFSDSLISIQLFPSWPHALLLAYNSTIITEYQAESSLRISPWYDHEFTLSIAYMEDSIHSRVSDFPSFPGLQVDPWIWLQLPVCLPPRSTATSQLRMRSRR